MNDKTNLKPLADIFEDDTAVTIVANLAGVEKEDLDISIEDQILTLCGKYISEEEEERKYKRQFMIGPDIDAQQINASMTNGVISIILPKVVKSQPKKISIKIN